MNPVGEKIEESQAKKGKADEAKAEASGSKKTRMVINEGHQARLE